MPSIFDIAKQQTPQWKKYLEDAPNFVIEETGLSREKLDKILSVLYDHRIIN